MSPQPQHPTRNAQQATSALLRRGPLRLVKRTWAKAWKGNMFSEAAEAAFWQILSLPPLLLGLLGSLGYVADWFGEPVINSVHTAIIRWSETAFSESVVKDIIAPTVNDILQHGRGEILTVGFLISLWAGSSAMSSFVDAITVAHDQYGVRNEVWQRIFALLLYMASLGLLVIGLPVLALGPDLLPNLFPTDWREEIGYWVNLLYYPAIGVLIVLALATLYKLALPRKLPWHRGLPGAVLAMAVFLLSSIGLRLYISWITTTGYTYGALATPIAFLLFAFFIGLAIVIGAYFNAAIQEMWPAKMTRRQRRRWRRLEMNRASQPMPPDPPTENPNNGEVPQAEQKQSQQRQDQPPPTRPAPTPNQPPSTGTAPQSARSQPQPSQPPRSQPPPSPAPPSQPPPSPAPSRPAPGERG